MVSAAWKNLSKEERHEWDDMARKDKKRFEEEKLAYKGPWRVPAIRMKPKRDPNAPKRPMSSFLAFSNCKRAWMRDLYPYANNTDISRMLADMWKKAPQQVRQQYIDEELRLRNIYKVAVAEFEANKKTDSNDSESIGSDEKSASSMDCETDQVARSTPIPTLDLATQDNTTRPATMTTSSPSSSGQDFEPISYRDIQLDIGGRGNQASMEWKVPSSIDFKPIPSALDYDLLLDDLLSIEDMPPFSDDDQIGEAHADDGSDMSPLLSELLAMVNS